MPNAIFLNQMYAAPKDMKKRVKYMMMHHVCLFHWACRELGVDWPEGVSACIIYSVYSVSTFITHTKIPLLYSSLDLPSVKV